MTYLLLNLVFYLKKFQKGQSLKIHLPLFQVLCEIQMAIVERKVTPRPDVTRDIMNEDRVLDETYRKLRDWAIFRDYMNCLEYVIEVFEYFKNNPAKLSPS